MNSVASLDSARRWLQEYGVRSRLSHRSRHRIHGDIRLTTGSGRSGAYVLDVKQRMGREQATALPLPVGERLLVVAPFISDAVAEILRRRGVDHVDSVGNAHLAWDDVLIDVRGRRAARATAAGRSARAGRAFGPAGLKVQFVLLSRPEIADRPLRELARAGGVSVGTAKTVVDELAMAGYLIVGPGGRRLVRGGDLLSRWAEAYSLGLTRTLAVDELSVDDISWLPGSEQHLLAVDVQVGGEAGGSLLDPHLRPASVTLYGNEVPRPLVTRHRMVRSGKRYPVHFRRKFWQLEGESWVVPSPLIYADLVASGDPRQREHADRLRASDDRLTFLDRS